MNRKIKSTLGLVGLLIFILIAGGVYTFGIQNSKIKKARLKLEELTKHDLDQQMLQMNYQNALLKVSRIDSALAARKYNVPKDLQQIDFYNFANKISADFSDVSKVNIEFVEKRQENNFFVFEYKVTGNADYNDLYQLIYGIEQSRELKKIKSATYSNMVYTDKDNVPNFLVSYTLVVDVYYAGNDRFTTATVLENDLKARYLYDYFYPLIRNEIPPNSSHLLDVQGARLLALVPEGAFLTDASGGSFLLVEGDQVYLGYLTKIDYTANRVSFVLNKGGIIERVTLQLEKENVKNSREEKK